MQSWRQRAGIRASRLFLRPGIISLYYHESHIEALNQLRIASLSY